LNDEGQSNNHHMGSCVLEIVIINLVQQEIHLLKLGDLQTTLWNDNGEIVFSP